MAFLKKFTFNFILVIMILSVLAGGGELIARFVENTSYENGFKKIEKSIYIEDPLTGLVFIPDSHLKKGDYTIDINSAGFRDTEHSIKKKKS